VIPDNSLLGSWIEEPISPIQKISDPILVEHGVHLWLKRDDLGDPVLSGNKKRKLKNNLLALLKRTELPILTFGGAFSNHIAAVAQAGKRFGFETIGVIRGEETQPLNTTLQRAVQCGMKLKYLNRQNYRRKDAPDLQKQLNLEFGPFHLIPEGGSNREGILGCREILGEIDLDFDVVCCSCGTGATLAGLTMGLKPKQCALGFSALKADGYHQKAVTEYLKWFDVSSSSWTVNTEFHFGGYAVVRPELVRFIQQFHLQHTIMLDAVYTGKMMYGIYECIRRGGFRVGTCLLAIHTGGIQGNDGIEKRNGVLLRLP